MNNVIYRLKLILESLEKEKITGKILLELNFNQGKVGRIYRVQMDEKRIELN